MVVRKADYDAIPVQEPDLNSPPDFMACGLVFRSHPSTLISPEHIQLIRLFQHCRERDNSVRVWPDGKPLLYQPHRLFEAFSIIARTLPAPADVEALRQRAQGA